MIIVFQSSGKTLFWSRSRNMPSTSITKSIWNQFSEDSSTGVLELTSCDHAFGQISTQLKNRVFSLSTVYQTAQIFLKNSVLLYFLQLLPAKVLAKAFKGLSILNISYRDRFLIYFALHLYFFKFKSNKACKIVIHKITKACKIN